MERFSEPGCEIGVFTVRMCLLLWFFQPKHVVNFSFRHQGTVLTCINGAYVPFKSVPSSLDIRTQ